MGDMFDQMAANKGQVPTSPAVSISQPVVPIATQQAPGNPSQGVTQERADAATNTNVQPAPQGGSDGFDQMAEAQQQTDEKQRVDNLHSHDNESMLGEMFRAAIGGDEKPTAKSFDDIESLRDLHFRPKNEGASVSVYHPGYWEQFKAAVPAIGHIADLLSGKTKGSMQPEDVGQLLYPERVFSTEENEAHPMRMAADQFLGSLTSPDNLLLSQGLGALGLAPKTLGKVLPRVASAVFSGQMGKASLDEANEAAQHWLKYEQTGDEHERNEAVRLGTHSVLNGVMAYYGGKHAAFGEGEGKTPSAPKPEEKDKRTILRPTTKTVAGVSAPISALQQDNPNFFTKAVGTNLATQSKASAFQEEMTKPAARRQAISVLSQVATDKIAAHDALVAGEKAPDLIAGTETPGAHQTPDEIWKAMQNSANQTYDLARDISRREQAEWQKEHDAAEAAHRAEIDRHNAAVADYNADPDSKDNPLEPIKYNPDDLDVRERPKTYDELKADLDTARDRLGKFNPTDVREKAKTVDVPKAEKALDAWFKEHEDEISPAEYNSAKSLWADSEKFKDIANNIRGKLAKGTLTGNDIRGLGAVVDNKAIRQRGQAGIGTFQRLVGDEAATNLNDIAKLFDPLDKSDPRYAMIKSWGGYAAKYVVGYMLAPMLGIPTWAAEGGALLTQYFMNKVMFDPEFGKSFARFVGGLQKAISTGVTMPSDMFNAFKDKLADLAEKYRNSRAGSETGAVGAKVRPRRSGPGAGNKPLNPEAPKDESTREYKDVGNGVHQVITKDAQGQALGQLVAQDVEGNPNATRVKSHWVGDEARGQGYGSKQIQNLAENLAAQGKTMLLSDTDMTESAKGAWDRLAAQNPEAIRKAGDGYIYDLTKLKESESHIANAADEYNKSINRPVLDQTKVNVDPNREKIADDFEAMKHDPENPRVKESYNALIDELKAQKAFLESKGYTFSLTDEDPYKSYEDMLSDIKDNKHISVWKGGNPLPEDHPLAKPIGDGWDGNTLLRAVHDIMGHAAGNNDFSEKGEENAYNLHKQAFSEKARPALTTETKGQTSWFFNNKGVREGAPLGQFAEQKAGLLPEFMNGSSEDVLNHIRGNKSFAVLTAENPQNTRLSVADNKRLNDKLLAQLKEDGFHPVEVEGHNRDVAGEKEHSFFVPDMSPETAAQYGRRFKQAAILTQEGLHDLNKNTVNPSDNAKVLVGDEAEKQPYYSSINGVPFSVPLDFEKEVAPKSPQMAGTTEGAIADTAFLQQAKAENPEGTVSQWLQRAQALKEAANAENAVKSEITTRRPTAVKADMSNVAGQNSNMDAVNQADRNSPSGKTAAGKVKLGYKTKLARTVASYLGMELTPEELSKMSPDQVIDKFVNHVSGNLEWLWNQIPPEIRDRTRRWYDAANGVMKTMAQKYGYSPEQAAGVTAATSPQNPWDNNLGLANRIMDIYRNRQNQPFTPEMEQKAAELKKVPTQSKAFKGLLKDIAGKKLGEVKSDNADVQAVQRALWIRLYDEAHGLSQNDQYSPTGEVVGLSPDTRSWIGLDHLAKAVKILDNGSVDNINSVMGQGHKIRNFYNNLISPMSKGGHTTIDTHAVAAGLLLPVGAKDLEAAHNFGGTLKGVPGPPKDASTGLQGTYPLFTEAYQQAARRLGILPRELQSVTWEAVKSLMGDEKKTPELKAQVKDIWHEVSEGKLTADEARAKIKSAANGFSKPAWMSDEEWEKLGPEGADSGFNPEEF